MLESGFHHLNHGSYGATLRVAQHAAERWRTAMDTCPSRFVEVRCKTRSQVQVTLTLSNLFLKSPRASMCVRWPFDRARAL